LARAHRALAQELQHLAPGGIGTMSAGWSRRVASVRLPELAAPVPCMYGMRIQDSDARVKSVDTETKAGLPRVHALRRL